MRTALIALCVVFMWGATACDDKASADKDSDAKAEKKDDKKKDDKAEKKDDKKKDDEGDADKKKDDKKKGDKEDDEEGGW